ncbi:hypothetical protein N2152v2_000217 [Parachlorella kessleri]
MTARLRCHARQGPSAPGHLRPRARPVGYGQHKRSSLFVAAAGSSRQVPAASAVVAEQGPIQDSLPSAAGVLPAVAVIPGSTEVQYLSKRAQDVETHFPTALGVDDFLQRLEVALWSFGFKHKNSIACVNLCRDEVTQTLQHKIEQVFGASFVINGLGGLLSCGLTGMAAGLSHSPADEALGGRERYIFFSFPHIAIDSRGTLGHISRPGRPGVSCACGAVAKALGDIKRDGLISSCKPPGVHEAGDVEFSILKQRLARRLEFEGHTDGSVKTLTLADLTKVAERTISKDLELLISHAVDTCTADYAVVTGVQIHNWGVDFDDPEPNLEFVAPVNVYAVVNGKQTYLDLGRLPGLTPRQIRVLAEQTKAASLNGKATADTQSASRLQELNPVRSAKRAKEASGVDGTLLNGTSHNGAAPLVQPSSAHNSTAGTSNGAAPPGELHESSVSAPATNPTEPLLEDQAQQEQQQPPAELEGNSTSGGTGVWSVHFAVQCGVGFGDSLAVVGSGPELGAWDAQAGLQLVWGEGDVWTGAVDLPMTVEGISAEFKVVKLLASGAAEWEVGDNRLLELSPSHATAADVAVSCCFGKHESLRVSVLERGEEPQLEDGGRQADVPEQLPQHTPQPQQQEPGQELEEAASVAVLATSGTMELSESPQEQPQLLERLAEQEHAEGDAAAVAAQQQGPDALRTQDLDALLAQLRRAKAKILAATKAKQQQLESAPAPQAQTKVDEALQHSVAHLQNGHHAVATAQAAPSPPALMLHPEAENAPQQQAPQPQAQQHVVAEQQAGLEGAGQLADSNGSSSHMTGQGSDSSQPERQLGPEALTSLERLEVEDDGTITFCFRSGS